MENEKISVEPKMNMEMKVKRGDSELCTSSCGFDYDIPLDLLALIGTAAIVGLHGVVFAWRYKNKCAEKNKMKKIMKNCNTFKKNAVKKAKKLVSF